MPTTLAQAITRSDRLRFPPKQAITQRRIWVNKRHCGFARRPFIPQNRRGGPQREPANRAPTTMPLVFCLWHLEQNPIRLRRILHF